MENAASNTDYVLSAYNYDPMNELNNASPLVHPVIPRTYAIYNYGPGNVNLNTNRDIDVSLQHKNNVLTDELRIKNAEIASLNETIRQLKVENDRLNGIVNDSWALSAEVEKWDDVLETMGKHNSLFQGVQQEMLVEREEIADLPSTDPDVLSRIDGLYAYHKNIDTDRVVVNRSEINKLFSELKPSEQNKIHQYISLFSHRAFLINLYTRFLDDRGEGSRRHLLGIFVANHLTVNTPPLELSDIVDYNRNKYNNNLNSNVCSLNIDYDTGITGDDYIYHRHAIKGYGLSMLHAFSHFDYSLKGSDVAKYHVGRACKISECSVIEICYNGKKSYYRPIKCSGSYVILPKLPGEVNFKVEAFLHRNGVVPLTLVRSYDIKQSDHFVRDSISQEVNGLLNKVKLSKVSIFFSEDGLCIKATGELSPIRSGQRVTNCCDRAYRFNGRIQRQHKVIQNNCGSDDSGLQ